MEKLHKTIAKGLGHTDTSPSTLAYKMLQENLYVNESFLQYAVNYIVIMATSPVIPLHLKSVSDECKVIYTSLQELGITGIVGRDVVDKTEFTVI